MKLEPGSNNNNFITATGRKNNKSKAKRKFLLRSVAYVYEIGKFSCIVKGELRKSSGGMLRYPDECSQP